MHIAENLKLFPVRMNGISCSEGCCVGINKARDVLLSGLVLVDAIVAIATARVRKPGPLLQRTSGT